MKLALTIIYLLICVALITIVLLQKGKDVGMSGAITGAAASSDSFFGKNKGRTKEAMLERFTAGAAILFVILAVVLSIVVK